MYNFFSIFENGDYAANQVYFYVSNANNSKNTCVNSAYAQQRFHFQKITGTLKTFFLLQIQTFRSLQRTIAKKKILNLFVFAFIRPPKWANLFLT